MRCISFAEVGDGLLFVNVFVMQYDFLQYT